jgi:hypothetical protein
VCGVWRICFRADRVEAGVAVISKYGVATTRKGRAGGARDAA